MSRKKAAGGDAAGRRPLSAPDPERGPAHREPDRGRRGRGTRRTRLPTRLAAIMVIPVAVALVLTGLRVHDRLLAAGDASDAELVARLTRSATALADRLQSERDLAAAELTSVKRGSGRVAAARRATDAALRTFRSDAGRAPGTARIRHRVRSAERALRPLETVRREAFRDPEKPLATEQAYTALSAPLAGFANELDLPGGTVPDRARAVHALSLVKASLSTQRTVVSRILVAGRATPEEVAGVLAARRAADSARTAFEADAPSGDAARYREAVRSPDVAASRRTADAVVAAAGAGKPVDGAGRTEHGWYTASSTEIERARGVEKDLVGRILAEADAARGAAVRQAVVDAAAALGALLLAGVLVLLAARSLVRDMRALRGGALDIAERRLPERVRRLAEGSPERADTRIEPLPLHGDDEIAEVARAFDAVHREAARLAGEQALLRSNVSSIFTNLSRRSQGLIERQLSLITELEGNEADPDQLSNLFKLDHLATRMRRNGENLLVLAGQEPGRAWTEPVPLVDVVRAAASEVEQYERITLSGVPDADVAGPAVNDLVHLLAELLENATSFSGPHAGVRITGGRLPGGRLAVEIGDEGIGLTEEDFRAINERLSRPPEVDAAVSRRMGLFVVGRLAARHGVRVRLRPSDAGRGTTCTVELPAEIIQALAPDLSGTVPAPDPAAPAGRHSARHRAPLETPPGAVSSPRAGPGYPQPPPASGPGSGAPDGPPAPWPGGSAGGRGGASTASVHPEHPYETREFDQFGGVSPGGSNPFATGMMPEVPSQPAPLEDDGVGSAWHVEEHRNLTDDDDERRRAEPPRRPHTDGTTQSGLPRRVPRAHLTPGAAEETIRYGPSVSRNPDDVRGRLTNLRRGVQQGRHQASEGHGPNPQEQQ